MSENPHLICAYALDGRGGGTPLGWEAARNWRGEAGAVWIHLDCTHPATEAWLRNESGLDAFVIDGLLADETRPRCDDFTDGTLVVLRGVNLNPGADPEDMVSIRLWVEERRVVSTRIRRLMAADDVRGQLDKGHGPVSAGHLLVRLAAQLTERMGPVFDELGDRAADLEESLIGDGEGAGKGPTDLRGKRHELADLRHAAISLRRYIAPQRDALNRLSQLDESWLDERVRGRLRDTVDNVTRITEELDELRERAAVVQDEVMNRVSQRMERTMYVLTVVATIMLPLGFLTGLLGINVAGIPGAETSWAFWAVCAALAVLVAVEVWLFKRLKWL